MLQRKIPLTIGVALLIVSALGSSMPAPKEAGRFKNLKVLPKDISEPALDRIMDNFNYALGVRCDFCHNRDEAAHSYDFAADTKGEKEIARNMMRMTNDLNKKYFNFAKKKIVAETVTCITCHRKNAIPLADTMPLRRH